MSEFNRIAANEVEYIDMQMNYGRAVLKSRCPIKNEADVPRVLELLLYWTSDKMLTMTNRPFKSIEITKDRDEKHLVCHLYLGEIDS